MIEKAPPRHRRWVWGVVVAVAAVGVAVSVGLVYGLPPRDPSPSVGRATGN